MACQGPQEHQEKQVPPESQDSVDHKERRGSQGQQGYQASANLAKTGYQGSQGFLVERENTAHQVYPGGLVYRDMASLDILGRKVCLALWGHQGVLASRDQKERVVPKGYQGKEVLKVSMDLQDFRASLGFLEREACQAHVVHLGNWALKGRVGTKEYRAFPGFQVCMAQGEKVGYQDQKVSWGHLASLVQQVSESQASKAPSDPRENLALLGLMANQDNRVCPGPRACLALQLYPQASGRCYLRWARAWMA
ncbi:hypothetical protein AAFF_G00433110 [Aldrovandia affinis]|uniref:Uncharacterized protein n=1 Tax=Aldrovandia affinis TaxID=143900 RepID=A0AAD7WJ52_9TELE|nr:hypothetical protein AAFF_G00433110 [Aldrovandia affinis]